MVGQFVISLEDLSSSKRLFSGRSRGHSIEEVLDKRHFIGDLDGRHGEILFGAVLRVDRLLSVVGGHLLHLVHRVHAALSDQNRFGVAYLALLVLAEVNLCQLLELIKIHHVD